MASVNGRPFLEWVVRYLMREGVQRMVISTGHKAEIVARHFDRQPVKNAVVQCVGGTAAAGNGRRFSQRNSGRESKARCMAGIEW